MRSKRTLNTSTGDDDMPFLDLERQGDALVRRHGPPTPRDLVGDDTPMPDVAHAPAAHDATPVAERPAVPGRPDWAPSWAEERSPISELLRNSPQRRLRVRPGKMVAGWLLLGGLGGLATGGLVGLIAGPIGSLIGMAVGGVLGIVLAVHVLALAGITYGVLHLIGRPPRTESQHVAAFVGPPAVLVILMFVSGVAAIVALPVLVVGLLAGPAVVRNGLERIAEAAPSPWFPEDAAPGPQRGRGRAPHSGIDSNDSPQEVN